jgi:S-adenosylmethionine:tRNA ribosyltransferase-isomerase
MLRTSELDYHLPEELIATEPASPRDAARLMVLRRSDPSFIAHRHVRDLPEYLSQGNLLVVNRTHVLPARFRGVRTDTGGKAEGLFVQEFAEGCHGLTGVLADKPCGHAAVQLTWQVLLKLRRTKPGVLVRLLSSDGSPSPIHLRLIERMGSEEGDDAAGWRVAVEGHEPDDTTQHILDHIGLTPLPPYILAARRRHEEHAPPTLTHPIAPDDRHDREVYQTVYAAAAADESHGRGSVAAPTAGLHFTPDLLARLAAMGIPRAEVVLHVGMGTFKPVETEFVEQHAMHSEWCTVPPETARAIQCATTRPTRRADGEEHGTILAVGTTTARTLESFASPDEMLASPARDTRILITPGYRFRHVGALMTNFHLPRSTLLAMVGAFLEDDDHVRGQGLARLIGAYRTAIEMGYRFYSFGDAMIILP